jgi:hypothetical protein
MSCTHEHETLSELEAQPCVEPDRQLHTEMREHDLVRRRERLVALAPMRKAAYERALLGLEG